MPIDTEKYREIVTRNFMKLLEVRGVATKLGQSIDKSPSIINGVKRGKPVNLMHLRAVCEVFGVHKMLEVMDINIDVRRGSVTNENVQELVGKIDTLSRSHPAAFAKVEAYITAAFDVAEEEKKSAGNKAA